MATKAINQEKNLPVEKKDNTEKKVERFQEVREFLRDRIISDHPNSILSSLSKELKNNSKNGLEATPNSDLYKAMTLNEFDQGILMASAIPERFRTFCIDFSHNLQKEYICETPSEKATAELVAINFIRTLDLQSKITMNLGSDTYNETTLKRFELLSKELDRANRHYFNSLQTLKMLKQPLLEVNIKTQTAVIGQNQIVQSNNK